MTDRLRLSLLRWEWAWTWGLGALAFMAVPLWQGGIGLSWDGLNHHIYLGWTAQSPRFDRDYWVASSQSYQYPYLYWPVYRLAAWGLDGVVAGLALASLHSLAIPPVWVIARRCCPGTGWFDLFTRLSALLLAFLTGVALVMLEITSNDLLATIPLLWAIAWALPADPLARTSAVSLVASGLATGVTVAFKLSNLPLVVVMPVLWMAASASWRQVGSALVAALAGWLLAYGYWGWQLWVHFGNPVYPLFDGVFEGLRQAAGWTP